MTWPVFQSPSPIANSMQSCEYHVNIINEAYSAMQSCEYHVNIMNEACSAMPSCEYHVNIMHEAYRY